MLVSVYYLPMKKALTLSIVIPVYNEEDYLGACLDAIKNQSVKPDEVIVVDNNSTDATAKIAKSYPFVRLITESNQGVMYARNAGFDTVKSDIIGRIDADTLLPRDWAREIKKFFTDSDFAAATGPAYWYDMPFGAANYKAEHFFKALFYKHAESFPFLLGANMAIRRSAWRAVRGEVCNNKRLYEDVDLAIHLNRLDFKLGYDKALRAGLSARRFDDRPLDFFRYISLYRVTNQAHGLPTVGPRLASFFYSVAYVILQPVRRSFDPTTNHFSWRKFLQGKIPPRRHPTD